ncbi:MAG TPA: TetR/AcrR family transcriptional regulator [Aurantimonas sp.]
MSSSAVCPHPYRFSSAACRFPLGNQPDGGIVSAQLLRGDVIMAVRKSAAERKAEILEATLKLADELGPDRLSTEAIARAVGLTQPGIFRHFPTKQAIWEAVAAKITEKMVGGWRTVLDRGGTPADRLRGLIGFQLRLIQATPAIPAILFSRELHAENDILRKSVLAVMNRLHAAIAREIAAAQEQQMFRREIEPDDAAYLVLGLIQGLAVRWSLSGRSFRLADEGIRLLEVQIGLFTAHSAEIMDVERRAESGAKPPASGGSQA